MNNELDVASKYGLFWASSWLEGDDGQLLADGTYIYQPQRFSETFFVIFDKLHQLNDYCFHQLLTVGTRQYDLVQQRISALARSGTGAEELDYLDDEIPRWEDNLKIVTQATSLILLCSFVEWALKRVAKDLHGCVPRKTLRSMSDMEFLLQHLAQAGLHFQLEPELLGTLDGFRNIRNAYAHGDWAHVAEQLNGLSLRACFEAVSQVFACLEEAAWGGPWCSSGV